VEFLFSGSKHKAFLILVYFVAAFAGKGLVMGDRAQYGKISVYLRKQINSVVSEESFFFRTRGI
jgi:hypothetical protein